MFLCQNLFYYHLSCVCVCVWCVRVCVCVRRFSGVCGVCVGAVCGARAVLLSSLRSVQHPRLHRHLLAARHVHCLLGERPRHRHQHR